MKLKCSLEGNRKKLKFLLIWLAFVQSKGKIRVLGTLICKPFSETRPAATGIHARRIESLPKNTW